MLLSVLILTIEERKHTFLKNLLATLEPQVRDKSVEILIASDNGQKSIGAKRNDLLANVAGEYFVFVDDDDRISPHYVDRILAEIPASPDCIVFDAWVTLNGANGKKCKYGIEFTHGNTDEAYYRCPNHIMVHRSENVKDISFLEVNFNEDDEWASRIHPKIKTQSRIDEILYFYEYSSRTSRSGRRKR